jgi:malate dehydrogenase (oxaloacetate-decarboxylating)
MIKNSISSKALHAHKKLKGKISIVPKAPLHSKKDLNIYYTPGVAAVSTYVATYPKEARNYTSKGNMVAVVSDGSAVLGLGNIGPLGALPVMEGKAMIFKAMAGIDAFPIVLSTQDTEEIIKTIINIAPGFGGINLEDISAPRCFEIEKRLREKLDIPVFHDDQHGTAMVVLAGLINALRVVKKTAAKVRVVISGSGAAGQAIANMILAYGVGDLIVLDSKGIISKKRKDLTGHKNVLLKLSNKRDIVGGLTEAIQKSDIFIGVSKPGLLTHDHVASMNEKAIIFALSNPIPEIMPAEAKKAGAVVIATGRSDFPNQLNNSLGFPGIFRGALDNHVKTITPKMLVQAAHNLAVLVKNPTSAYIIPDMFDRRVVKAVARAIK